MSNSAGCHVTDRAETLNASRYLRDACSSHQPPLMELTRISKLQDITRDVTSLRQYSPADAGRADEIKAVAMSAAIGAALHFKNVWM